MAFWNRNNEPKNPVVRRFGDGFGWLNIGKGHAKTLTAQSALETSAVLCAVKVIAEGMGQMPIRLIETQLINGLERTRVAKEHWAHKLLAVRPNNFQTSSEFIEGMIVNAVLGKGALAIKNTVNGQVRELLPVVSGAWTAEITENYEVYYVVSFSNGQQVRFPQSQCIFIKGLSLDGLEGISAIEKARKAVGIGNFLEEQQLGLAANGGRPSGILKTQESLTPDQATSVADDWNKNYSPDGKGGIAVLDHAMSFETISLSLADSQFIENRKFQIEEIARTFRVQPTFLMVPGSVADAKAEDRMRMHVTHTLGPWMRRIESALNKSILNDADGLHFDFDEGELLRGDHATQANYFKSALGSGGTPAWMSTNEVRYECGLDPIDEDWARKPSKGGYAEAAGMSEQETDK